MFKNKRQSSEIALLRDQLAAQQMENQQLKQTSANQTAEYQALIADHERLKSTRAALDKSMAMIEFDTSGQILSANDNFLGTVRYSLDEVKGKHHRIFCDDSFYQNNPRFWQDLAAGRFNAGKFKRFNKQGEDIWLEATYNPIFNGRGEVVSIIKFASDITQSVNESEAVKAAAKMAATSSQESSKVVDSASKQLAQAVTMTEEIAETIKSSATAARSLTEQAQSINAIVSVIKSIADQTNLLALNAAIEAARAGEQGRGFAVVADEVRTLALRTSSSTADISEEVEKTQGVAQSIAQLVDELNAMIDNTTKSVQAADNIMHDVKAGSENVVRQITKLL